MDDSSSSAAARAQARYPVTGSYFSPLSQAKLFVAGQSFEILNISLGGLAFCVTENQTFQSGQSLDVSVSLMDRDWPVRIDVRDARGFRVSVAFLNKSEAFAEALREFLEPKRLASTLAFRLDLSSNPEVLQLQPGAQLAEVYTGENESGVFVWLGAERQVVSMLVTAEGLLIRWDVGQGLRTGHWSLDRDLVLDSDLQMGVAQWFFDFLLAWLGPRLGGQAFVAELAHEKSNLRFPSSLEALLS